MCGYASGNATEPDCGKGHAYVPLSLRSQSSPWISRLASDSPGRIITSIKIAMLHRVPEWETLTVQRGRWTLYCDISARAGLRRLRQGPGRGKSRSCVAGRGGSRCLPELRDHTTANWLACAASGGWLGGGVARRVVQARNCRAPWSVLPLILKAMYPPATTVRWPSAVQIAAYSRLGRDRRATVAVA